MQFLVFIHLCLNVSFGNIVAACLGAPEVGKPHGNTTPFLAGLRVVSKTLWIRLRRSIPVFGPTTRKNFYCEWRWNRKPLNSRRRSTGSRSSQNIWTMGSVSWCSTQPRKQGRTSCTAVLCQKPMSPLNWRTQDGNIAKWWSPDDGVARGESSETLRADLGFWFVWFVR